MASLASTSTLSSPASRLRLGCSFCRTFPCFAGLCNGWYDSDRALHDHMQTAHRRFISEKSTFQRGTTYPGGVRNQLGSSNEGWAKFSTELRNLLQARFTQEE